MRAMTSSKGTDLQSLTHKQTPPILILLIIGAVCVAVYSVLADISVLNLLGIMNDQAVYVDAARHLLYEGRSTTGIIYPSVLQQEFSHNYFYMPGHATMLAMSFWIWGDNVIAALLPNLFAYFLSIILLYWIGSRLVNHRVGFIAGFLFAIFPVHIIYGVSAMAEMTFICAGLIAFAVFLRLPGALRPWLGPILLALPVLFRETGALWLIPMAIITLTDPNRPRRYWETAALSGLGVALIILILQLDFIKDRPSRLYLNLLSRSSMDAYQNAFSVENNMPKTMVEWYRTLITRIYGSLKSLWWLFSAQFTRPHIMVMYLSALFWPPFFGIIVWRKLPNIRKLTVSYMLMAFTIFTFISTFYVWDPNVAVRLLLILFPFEAIIIAAIIDNRVRAAWQYVVIGCLLGVPALYLSITAAEDTKLAKIEQTTVMQPLLNSLGLQRGGVLLSDYSLGPLYVYENYPAKWAFVPANEQTLILLNGKHPVAMAILDKEERALLGDEALQKIGLAFTEERVKPDGSKYFIFRRPLLHDRQDQP